jgi:hypothetical protein
VRPTPDARVSAPLDWDEVAGCDPAAFTLKTMPARLRERGDPAAGIDGAAGTLDALLALSDRQMAAGMPDAPWPPHYEKQAGEAPRVMPSRRRRPPAPPDGAAPATKVSSTGRRKVEPGRVITIARAQDRDVALAALERWKARFPEVVARLSPENFLVDSMRGRSYAWTRVRIDLKNIPAAQRPAQEPLEVDVDPWSVR